MCQFFIDNWDKFTTILLSVVAIAIAILSSRHTSKAATKQIESIKTLSKLQAEIATIELQKELWEIRYRWRQNSMEILDTLDDTDNILKYQNDPNLAKVREKTEKNRQLSHEQDFYMKQMRSLEGYTKRMESVKKELGLS